MNDQSNNEIFQKIITAYENMLERAMDEYQDFRESVDKLEHKAAPALREFIDKSKDAAVKLEELTEEESSKIAEYVKRDLKDAAQWMVKTGQDLRQWFNFEGGMAKLEIADLFMKAADQTKVDMARFEHEVEEGGIYHTGQIVGPGIMVCESCGEELHFAKASHIPPCPKCHGVNFHRQADKKSAQTA